MPFGKNGETIFNFNAKVNSNLWTEE